VELGVSFSTGCQVLHLLNSPAIHAKKYLFLIRSQKLPDRAIVEMIPCSITILNNVENC
jgi:hypothetical protein